MKRSFFLTAVVLCVASVAVAGTNAPYGINAHVPSTQLLDMLAAAGIQWVRVDMNWFQLEPGRNQYNWGYMDNVVNAARARGLQIFATLAYSPNWASGTANIADPPQDPNDWYNFVYNVVRRYKSSVKHWGMWNEPNLDGFWTGEAWQYREWILKNGYNAAKAADASCVVLGPELAHMSGWPDFMENVMAEGGANYIDIITHHCYKGDTGTEVFNYLDKDAFYWAWDDPPLMKVLDDLGVDNRPVWLTEVGWTTADGDGSVSEDEQADYYHQLLWGVHERAWLERVFPYEAMDDPTPGVPKWGIIKADYTPKKAYTEYQSFIDNPTDPGSSGGCGAAEDTSKPQAELALVFLVPLAGFILRRRR